MLRNRFAAILVGIGIFGIASSGLAQERSSKPSRYPSSQVKQEKSFIAKVDDFGRSVFEGILPSMGRKEPTRSASRPNPDFRRAPTPRAGSVATYGANRSSQSGSSAARKAAPTYRKPSSTRNPYVSQSAATRVATQADRPVGKSPKKPLLSERFSVKKLFGSLNPRGSTETVKSKASTSHAKGTATGLAGLPASSALPLHERLNGFRKSQFADVPTIPSTKKYASVEPPTGPALETPLTSMPAMPMPTTPTYARPTATPNASQPTLARPTIARSATPTSAPEPARLRNPLMRESSRSPTLTSPYVGREGASGSALTPVDTQNRLTPVNAPRVTAPIMAAAPITPKPAAAAPAFQGAPVVSRSPPQAMQSTASRASDAWSTSQPVGGNAYLHSPIRGGTAETDGRRNTGVLFNHKSPVLNVETVGPQKITIGKESVYEVTIYNAGAVVADEVVVQINLPTWTKIVGADASVGTARAVAPTADTMPFAWKVGTIAAHGRERLLLKIVPLESRPFDLGVRWDCRPVTSQTMIEVQEPKLAMHIDGPSEVLFGKAEIFRLIVSNTGTGPAEETVITLMPIGTGQNQPISHKLGTVAAGGRITVEVELTARQVGDLLIQAKVDADAGIHAEASETVLVRRAALAIDAVGPDLEFVGAVADYRISVRNPGTASAEQVELTVALPPGTKYLSGVQGARLDPSGRKLSWTLAKLEAASEQTFLVQCHLTAPGATRFDVAATANDNLAASGTVVTQVQAIADLTLTVNDPTGPIPVGQEVTYKLHVANRGTKTAEGVEVVVYFSRGIEPTVAQGGRHRIEPGQVIFNALPPVPVGGEIMLTIRARAETAGNHTFRAEVHCEPLGTRLVSEETTRFYRKGNATSSTRRSMAERPPQLRPVAPLQSAGWRQAPMSLTSPTMSQRDQAVPPVQR